VDCALPEHRPGLLDEMDAFIEAEIKPLERGNVQYSDRRREFARTDFENGGIPPAGVGGRARRDAPPRRCAGSGDSDREFV
jgi:hypothetical protein